MPVRTAPNPATIGALARRPSADDDASPVATAVASPTVTPRVTGPTTPPSTPPVSPSGIRAQTAETPKRARSQWSAERSVVMTQTTTAPSMQSMEQSQRDSDTLPMMQPAPRPQAVRWQDLEQGAGTEHGPPTPRGSAQGSTDEALARRLQEVERRRAANGVSEDHDFAMTLQLDEVEQHNSQKRQRRFRQHTARSLNDPVWGEVVFTHSTRGDSAATRGSRMASKCCFWVCPWVVVSAPCWQFQITKAPAKKQVAKTWARVLTSAAILSSFVQLAVLLVVIYRYGEASDDQSNAILQVSVQGLDEMGAKNAGLILYENEWWRLVTPMFLHAGWLHIISNLLLQMRTGLVLEFLWGTPTWLAIYLISGIYASVCSCVTHPNILSVGSSGACCGLIGAWFPFILATWNQTLPADIEKRNAQLTLIVCAILLLLPLGMFAPMVDNAAHVGGCGMGILLGMVFFASKLQDQRWRRWVFVVGIVLSLAVFSGTFLWFVFNTKPEEPIAN